MNLKDQIKQINGVWKYIDDDYPEDDPTRIVDLMYAFHHHRCENIIACVPKDIYWNAYKAYVDDKIKDQERLIEYVKYGLSVHQTTLSHLKHDLDQAIKQIEKL